jgi:hypothetical protein
MDHDSTTANVAIGKGKAMKTVVLAVIAVTSLLLPAVSEAAEPLLPAKETRILSRPPGTREFVFTLTVIPRGEQVRLSLDARVDWRSLSGFNPWMVVDVNGRQLRGPQLLNKPVQFTTRNGVDFVWDKAGRWTVLYPPDFSDSVRTRAMPWGFPDTELPTIS